MALMGVDIGTTGTKAIVFDLEGNILSSAYSEYHLKTPQPGWVELDTHEVWEGIRNAISRAARESAEPVSVLSISSQGETITPIDKDGNILGGAITHLDNRTAEITRRWPAKIDPLEMMHITGIPLSYIPSINKIIWWKENRPDVYAKTYKFLCYEDFLIYKLGLEPTIDYSMAARTMAFDIINKKWSTKILEMADVDEGLFADAKPSGYVVGEVSAKVAEELGLSNKTKVVTGGHDQPSNALGAGIIEANMAIDGTGTVECVTAIFPEPVINKTMLESNLCCYPSLVPNMYATLAFNFSAGCLLKWYKNNFCRYEIAQAEKENRDVYDVLLENLPDRPTDILLMPHFMGTGTPYMDPNPTSAILGTQISTTRDEFLKGLLEGITYEMKLNLSILEKAGVHLKELRAVGGGAKSEKWLQLKADMFNKKIVSLNVSEGACLGVALSAGVATGQYASLKEATDGTVKSVKEYHPDAKKAKIYDEKFEKYKKIYSAVKSIYAQEEEGKDEIRSE